MDGNVMIQTIGMQSTKIAGNIKNLDGVRTRYGHKSFYSKLIITLHQFTIPFQRQSKKKKWNPIFNSLLATSTGSRPF
jgi:hypothetical protein